MFRKALIVLNAVFALILVALLLTTAGSSVVAWIFIFGLVALLATNAVAIGGRLDVPVPGFRLWKMWAYWVDIKEAELQQRHAALHTRQDGEQFKTLENR
jgi:hypothetical protein